MSAVGKSSLLVRTSVLEQKKTGNFNIANLQMSELVRLHWLFLWRVHTAKLAYPFSCVLEE